MRKFIRWLGRVVLAVSFVVAIAGFWKRDDLVRLYHVNTLFDEGKIAGNFSSMEGLFFHTNVKRTGETALLVD